MRSPRRVGRLLGCGLAALSLAWGAGLEAEDWRLAQPDYGWSFPADHWSHPGFRTEWWYFTGHLASREEPSRQFGFQFTFFRIGLKPQKPELNSDWAAANLIMGHAAVSEPARSFHRFSEVLYREMPLLGGFGRYPDRRIAWSLAPPGSEGTWTLFWNGRAFDFAIRDDSAGLAFELSTEPLRPRVFQGPGGFSRKNSRGDSASNYYSFTRLRAQGTLRVGEEILDVEGNAWMDHEFGSGLLTPEQVGWDWFSLQLEDGSDLMLFRLRNHAGGTDYAHGTLVFPDGRIRYLEEWPAQATRRWTSPATQAVYPAGWIIRIEGREFQVRPRMADQENRSLLRPGLNYWEGSVTVEDFAGNLLGQGYAELTGYAPGSRPPL